MIFDSLFGFSESKEAIDRYLRVEGSDLLSDANGTSYGAGCLCLRSLTSLRLDLNELECKTQIKANSLSAVVGDARELHSRIENKGALFQVASQFNLLEMMSPTVTPEQGVGIYENDYTQGPACALAAFAGTLYRNYFVELAGQRGQSANKQINTICALERRLREQIGNQDEALWKMRNGYVLLDSERLSRIFNFLRGVAAEELDKLRSTVEVGLHWDVEVTDLRLRSKKTERVNVSQVYCSAMPVSYNRVSLDLWVPLATLVLEATYEATLIAAVLNRARTGVNKVFLTLVGGGAFGNQSSWILSALERALRLVKDQNLDIRIVCYGEINEEIVRFVEQVKDKRLCV